MALVVHWYDFVCFAIVAGATLGSLWFVRREGGRGNGQNETKYESLLPDVRQPIGNVQANHRGHVGGSCLWTSCWRRFHPGWLLVLRLVSAGVLAGLLWWDVRTYDWLIFVYYTEWTVSLVIVYFALATLVSAHGCWNYSRQSPSETEERNQFLQMILEENGFVATSKATSTEDASSSFLKLQSHQVCDGSEQSAGIWGYTMQIIYQTCAGAVMLTDIVFWGLIVPFLTNGHFTLNPLMGCMHTLNFLFLLLDTALNNMPFPMFRMTYFVLWSCVYVIFQWVLHACGFSWWPYPFLELSTPLAPLWYFVMALVHVPCYGFYFLVVKAKNALFSKLFPNAYINTLITSCNTSCESET